MWASSAALVGMIWSAQCYLVNRPPLNQFLRSWTVFSDTVYAQQDLKDDEIAGVKSTARLFGQRIRQITSLFALAFIACFLLSGVLNGNGTPYFTIGCGGAAVNVIWMILGWHTNDDKSSARLFLVSIIFNRPFMLQANITLDSGTITQGLFCYSGWGLTTLQYNLALITRNSFPVTGCFLVWLILHVHRRSGFERPCSRVTAPKMWYALTLIISLPA